MVKRILLTAACLLPLSGCSFLFVNGPPDPVAGRQATGSVSCTDSILVPALDFLGGAGFLFYGISALWLGGVAEGFEDAFDATGDESVSDEIDIFGYALLGGAAALAYSGIQGRNKVHGCRALRAAAADAASPFAASAASSGPGREAVYMQKSVWHDVLDQYRRQQDDLVLPSGRK